MATRSSLMLIFGKAIRFACLILAAYSLSTPLWAEGIYKWVDENGNLQFSDTPPKTRKAEELKLKINSVTIPKLTIDPSTFSSTNKVVIFTTNWCGVCKKAKKYMRNNNIAYQEYDIEKSTRARREFDRLHGTGVPLIVVGNQRLTGFSAKRLRAMLKKK